MVESLYGNKKNSKTKGFFLIFAGLIILVGFFGGYWYLKSTSITLSSDTWCPTDGPLGKSIVLIDITDPVPDIAKIELEKLFDRLWDPKMSKGNLAKSGIETSFFLEPYHQLSVYTITNASPFPEPIAVVCNPGLRSEVGNWDELISNPQMINQRIKNIIEELSSAIESIPMESSLPESPLLESLKNIASKERLDIFDRANGKQNLKIFFVSDFIQNSNNLSHFNELPSWASLQNRTGFSEIDANLDGFDFYMYYITRKQYAKTQRPEHIAWWLESLENMAANVSYLIKL